MLLTTAWCLTCSILKQLAVVLVKYCYSVFVTIAGYTKQVMVIYNGVHYDALAVSSSPRSDPDDDITEFNPRTKRGKMILAAAQQLVSWVG